MFVLSRIHNWNFEKLCFKKTNMKCPLRLHRLSVFISAFEKGKGGVTVTLRNMTNLFMNLMCRKKNWYECNLGLKISMAIL